ncbi:hypothetical protein A0J61_02114 [Choanephora cucurbitarum]|uniref:Mid2 domain-containing protein n=1 Tax=Choanephora cucurbitarum TaxID=101091 RepID=A0A1C7NL31_9FUNG|nr:hypothetical protein A0J61_02114 [Choanephora cucurbitarum]
MDVSTTGDNGANATPTTQLSGNEVPSDTGTTVAPTSTSGTTTPTTTTPPPPTTTTTTTVDNISTTRDSEQPVSTTTSNDIRPTTTSEQPESSSNRQSNTNGLPVSTSTTIPASTTVTRAVTRSSAVPIVSVSSSGSVVRTITSTSYSAYVTNEPTSIPYDPSTNSSSSSKAGPIAGGVVGGVAGLALIGAIAFILMKRQYNNYYENGSQYTGPTVGTMSSQATKPRPFVQAYEPVNTTNQPYYYNNTNGYDPYYPPQQNMMMNYGGDRHVPDEIDYDTTTTSSGRRMSRHVPNEV